jgi:lysophospholipid acyltransferase (LPLAT)-like uncharacterized protein
MDDRRAIHRLWHGAVRKIREIAFTPRKIIAEKISSVIEFELLLDDQKLIGTDVIKWSPEGGFKALRAYLYSLN